MFHIQLVAMLLVVRCFCAITLSPVYVRAITLPINNTIFSLSFESYLKYCGDSGFHCIKVVVGICVNADSASLGYDTIIEKIN